MQCAMSSMTDSVLLMVKNMNVERWTLLNLNGHKHIFKLVKLAAEKAAAVAIAHTSK